MLAITFATVSLVQAKPKDPRTPKEKQCDDQVIKCAQFCMGTTIQDVREKCENECWNKWNKCNGYAARPRPNIPRPKISLPDRIPTQNIPGVGVNAEKNATALSPTPTPKPKQKPTPTNNG